MFRATLSPNVLLPKLLQEEALNVVNLDCTTSDSAALCQITFNKTLSTPDLSNVELLTVSSPTYSAPIDNTSLTAAAPNIVSASGKVLTITVNAGVKDIPAVRLLRLKATDGSLYSGVVQTPYFSFIA